MSKSLQQDLVELGYGNIVGSIDGIIGTKTKNAIKTLQADCDLVVDGLAGVNTKRAIKNWKESAGKKGTRNFQIKEFYSPDTHSIPKNGMSNELLLNLEFLRWKLDNKPMKVTSGYRTKEFNAKVGGIWNSNHLTGLAADIKVIGVSPNRVQAMAEQIFNGVGRYKYFTHVDVHYKKVHFTGAY